MHVAKMREDGKVKVMDDTLVFQFKTRWGMPQMIGRVRKRAGLKHYRPHQIGRHAFASRHLNSGKTLKDVKEAGGWKKITMVDEYYGHLEKKRVHDIVANVDTAALQKPTPNLHPDANTGIETPVKKRGNAA